jgi:hypothetical protein
VNRARGEVLLHHRAEEIRAASGRAWGRRQPPWLVWMVMLLSLVAPIWPVRATDNAGSARTDGPAPGVAASRSGSTPGALGSQFGAAPGGSAPAWAQRSGSATSVLTLPRGPDPVVIAPYRARIRAAHRLHSEQAKMTCLDCHVRATTSSRAADWLGPSAESCERCHQVNHRSLDDRQIAGDGRCQKCHLGLYDERRTSHLHNSHASHRRRNIHCQRCHGRVERLPDAIGSERLPTKSVCIRCHAGRGSLDGAARSDCTLCHESEGGRIRTRFQGQLLKPGGTTPALEHGNDWLYRHRDTAGNDPRRCDGCHTTGECQACHDGRLRPRNVHPGDWLSAHSIAAKQDASGCSSCHRQQSFCLSCHQRLGLGPSGASAAMASRGAMHPPASVWTRGSATAPTHHGTQARRNLSECVSCHQERDCVRCHATSAARGAGAGTTFGTSMSPHPPGFSASCASYWSRNPRPCLVCHRPDGSELLRCR